MAKSTILEIDEICSIVKNTESGVYSVVFTVLHIDRKATFLLQTNLNDIVEVMFSKDKLLNYMFTNKSTVTAVVSPRELIAFYTEANLSKHNKDNVVIITDDAYVATDHKHYLVAKGEYNMVNDGIELNYGTKRTPDISTMEFTLENPVIKYTINSVFCNIYKMKDIYEIILSKMEVSGE